MGENKTSIWIADDHQLFNEGIKTMLQGEPDLVVTGQVSSGPEVLEKLRFNTPDLILLDINMPKLNGLDLAAIIKKEYPGIMVIVVSMYNDQQFVDTSKKMG